LADKDTHAICGFPRETGRPTIFVRFYGRKFAKDGSRANRGTVIYRKKPRPGAFGQHWATELRGRRSKPDDTTVFIAPGFKLVSWGARPRRKACSRELPFDPVNDFPNT